MNPEFTAYSTSDQAARFCEAALDASRRNDLPSALDELRLALGPAQQAVREIETAIRSIEYRIEEASEG